MFQFTVYPVSVYPILLKEYLISLSVFNVTRAYIITKAICLKLEMETLHWLAPN